MHELREQFLQQVVNEWPSKWQKEFEEFSSFEALKSKNAFLEALLADIEDVLHQRLNGKTKNELFSKDFLRRFIFEYGTKEVRIQTRFRNVIAVYLGYADWDDFQQKITTSTAKTFTSTTSTSKSLSYLPCVKCRWFHSLTTHTRRIKSSNQSLPSRDSYPFC
ncbi:MAG: hypothetical protein R2822_25255 [Spirosomataceae bacterium]